MDIASAQHLVTGTEESLRKCARDFQGVMRAADDFVERANGILEKLEDSEAEVQTSLPEKRIRKHKRQPGELAQDEPIANADTDYKINIHNVILDTVIESFHSRYAENAVLCSDVSCMDPRNFPEIREKGLPGTAMKELSKCLLQFDERASLETLQAELISLAQHWERLKQSLMENYNIRGAASNDEAGEGSEVPNESVEFVSRSCSKCKNCPICCYLLLSQYNLLTDAYHIIGLGYKFLLTLSIIYLVACERTFSTLKLVKSRLRTSLSQDNLEAFLLMATEKEILMELDKDDIIDKMAESSELLRRLLVY
ncbi:GMP reductase [Labeo rohita]|uniref:GMP reductase n=1 Tax=Labeo rohita TaxID=84645 RepID=A0ABQ8L794_LABRO|nr:GMP reductase [Labeo rohita]